MRRKQAQQDQQDGEAGGGGAATTPLKDVNKILTTTPLAGCSSSPARIKQPPASDSKCYSRRRRKLKLDQDVSEEEECDQEAPSTCPPALPTKRKRRRRRDSSSSLENDDLPVKVKQAPKFPKKFVEEQRKYFAEVDAFELQEADQPRSSSESE